MQFLAENLPQHFGGDGPVVLSQRGTQKFIHKRLIATAGGLGLGSKPPMEQVISPGNCKG